MNGNKVQNLYQLFLRLAIGISYFFFGADRLGLWGKYGDKNVSWGDWGHFMEYASKVMGFLPFGLAQVFAGMATACEITFGIMLIIGLKTRYAAIGSGALSLLFALSMTVSFGIFKPLAYSVFTVSAASFLLSTINEYKYTVDRLYQSRIKN